MGLAEVLTLIFVALKLLGVISWSWWLVFLPEIIAGAIYVIILIVNIVIICSGTRKVQKHVKKHFEDIDW